MNEYYLHKIAIDDEDPRVRIAAVNGLSSDNMKYYLINIVRYDSDANVREVATNILAKKQKYKK